MSDYSSGPSTWNDLQTADLTFRNLIEEQPANFTQASLMMNKSTTLIMPGRSKEYLAELKPFLLANRVSSLTWGCSLRATKAIIFPGRKPLDTCDYAVIGNTIRHPFFQVGICKMTS